MLNDVQITSCQKLVVMSPLSSQLIHRNYHISPRYEHLRHGDIIKLSPEDRKCPITRNNIFNFVKLSFMYENPGLVHIN